MNLSLKRSIFSKLELGAQKKKKKSATPGQKPEVAEENWS